MLGYSRFNFIISLMLKFHKIPKISLGAYIFQRPFLRGLFVEWLIFGGAFNQTLSGKLENFEITQTLSISSP